MINSDKMILFCFLSVLIVQCKALIYSLNESEYKRMPPLFSVDDYCDCMTEPNSIYCVVDFELFSTKPSELIDFIKEYSAHTTKHFNHTQVHRGICLTEKCKFYNPDRIVAPNMALEGCFNESISERYGIEAKLSKVHYCKRKEDVIHIDNYDIAVAMVYTAIILLNIIGSTYDYIKSKSDDKAGNVYLMAFSIQRNWKKMVAPAGVGSDPRLKRLKLFYGIRAMTMICVIFSHTAIIMSLTYIANPLYIEKAYDDPLKQILFNGSLVIHTFFVMSSFLLAYNLQMYKERQELKWTHIPKALIVRWFRLTPPYALIIATISTWIRHIGDGPLWQIIVTSESNVCRQYWWANIFYFNNYIYKDDLCFPQGWYLAADTQLFCLGLVLLVVIQSPRGRNIALLVLFLASLVITAAHTYFEDLDAVVIQSPESYRSLYISDATFRLVYIRGHTNISTYTMGLAGGLFTYYWQQINMSLIKYKNYRWLLWLEFPLAVAVILSGGFFYMDGVEPSTYVRILYATFYKPIFQALVVSFIVLTIFKFDNLYRSIVEWRGFTWAGRVSYSAFLTHTIFQRGYIGKQIAPLYITDYNVLILLCASIFLSFITGAILWLAVEAPVAALSRAVLSSKKDK